MKARFVLLIICKYAILLSFFFFLFSACDMEAWSSGYNSFDFDLQGTWVTHDPDERYSGRLEINFDRITITGYGSSQTPDWWGNDAERPFRDFIKGVSLKGYSVHHDTISNVRHGSIYIEHIGEVVYQYL